MNLAPWVYQYEFTPTIYFFYNDYYLMENTPYLDSSIKELFDEMPVMVAWYDLDMRLLWANKALVNVLGKPLEILVEKTCRQIWRFAQVDISDYPVAIAKQTKQVVERQISLADGSMWSVRASPIFNQAGELIALSEIIRDTNASDKEKAVLKQNEKRNLAFIEAVNNLALMVDKDYRIQSALGKRLADYPIKLGDAAEDTLKHLCPCAEAERILEYCKRVFETNESLSVECVYEFNQEVRADLIYFFPIDLKETGCEQVGILCRDITTRKNAEIALKEREKILQDIIEFLPDATFVIDRKGKVLAWNRAIEEMTGIKKEKMLGEGDFVYAVPFYGEKRPILIDMVFDENASLKKGYSNLKQHGENLIAEVYLPNYNAGKGAHFWVTASPLYNNNGELIGSIECIREISEQKEAENQLITTLAEKEALLRELYHRTKNNMQMISSMLSLQADLINDQQVVNVFKDMENRIRSMALVHQRLYQSRNLSSIDLAEYMNELIGLLFQSYNAHPDLVNITLEAEPVTVLIDIAIPCGLIVNELVSNSLKYAFPDDREGEIVISMFRLPGGELLLGVRDNGVGVSPGFDPHSMGKLGMQIVFALGEQQLGGNVTFDFEHGFSCKIRFPLSLENFE